MIIDAGLVLEGGGMRCVFTAGILDYFMEKDLYFKHVYGVSGSAYVSLNYLSGQIGRTKTSNIDYMKHEKLLSLRSFFKTGSLFNMDVLFDKLPNQIMPFDYKTFFSSGQQLIMSVTNMLTGKPIYFSEYESNDKLMEVCKCSNCFPLISPIQYLNGVPVLDGGMSDAIPIRRALKDRHEKIVAILTKERGFRKKVKKKNHIISLRYRKYPKFVKMVNNRPRVYNNALDCIDQLEKKGDVYAIYPQCQAIGLVERKSEKLVDFYIHGYEYAKKILPDVLKYLEIN